MRRNRKSYPTPHLPPDVGGVGGPHPTPLEKLFMQVLTIDNSLFQFPTIGRQRTKIKIKQSPTVKAVDILAAVNGR
ncbi:MAG: hypothetical protein GPJ33_10115 [Microcystis aeruginosa W11-03]|nr:hypothetical protein [Microcystis aeruginosa W11-03]